MNFTAGRWFALLWDDWAHRNGRLADAVLRLALRPGHGAFTVLNPVVLTLLGAACALWLGAFRGRRVNPTLLALGLLGLPLVLSVWPRLTGDTALWAAGAVYYLWPTVAVVTVGAGHVAVAGGWEPERRWALCLGLLDITGQLMHELASLAVGGMAVLTWLLARRQLGDGARVLVRLGWLGTLLQLAAPGLWGRVSTFGPAQDPGPSLATKVVASMVTSTGRLAPLWLAVLVVLLLGFRQVRGAARETALLGAASLANLLAVCAFWVFGHGVPVSYATVAAQGASLGWATTVAIALGLLGVAAGLVALGPVWGLGPAYAWVAGCAALGPPLVMGLAGPRAHLLTGLWLFLCAAGAATGLAERLPRPIRRRLAAAVLAVACLVSTLCFVRAYLGSRESQRWIGQWVTPQVEAARRGEP